MAGVGTVCWFEIPADDVERAKAFYSALVEWTFTESVEFAANYWSVLFDQDAAVSGGILQRARGDKPTGSGPIVYLRVEDLESSLEKVLQLGGEVVQSSTRIPPDDGSFALIRDTEGNIVGLWAN